MTTHAQAILDTIGAAHDGKQVLVVSPRRVAAKATLDRIEQLLTTLQADVTVRRTNGAERIAFPSGGSVTIASAGSTGFAHGRDLDLVYLDDVALDDAAMAAVGPALFARDGAIVP